MTDEKTQPMIVPMAFDKETFDEGGKFPTPTTIAIKGHVRVLRVFEAEDRIQVWVTTPSQQAVERYERNVEREEGYPDRLAEWEAAHEAGKPEGGYNCKPSEPLPPTPIQAPLLVVRLGEEVGDLEAKHTAIVGVVDDLIFMAPVGEEPSLFGSVFGGLF